MGQLLMLLRMHGQLNFGTLMRFGSHKLCRIMSATVRDNILFSHEYDEVFYNVVIEGDFILQLKTKSNLRISMCT